MGSNNGDLHFFFFPFMAQGHFLPAIDMAKLFACRGHRSTIVTTAHHSHSLSKMLLGTAGIEAAVVTIPCSAVGLPDGVDSFHMVGTFEGQQKFIRAIGMLAPQLDELLRLHRPDCLVADVFFPWAIDVAEKHDVPVIIFHGTSYFALCASLSVFLHRPHEKSPSGSEPFIIPGLPDEISFTRDKIPDYERAEESEFAKMQKPMKLMELKSYGVLVNSFSELEPRYPDCYTGVFGINKTWHVGPLLLHGERETGDDGNEVLKWLDGKEPDSVVYACFGSLANLSDAQLTEIAAGLEASDQKFIWVVNREKREEEREEWLPVGFEERVAGRGVLIRGWAPQVKILEHVSVGAFVTHCGWNSTLEGVCAGVAMATWPLSAEQFYNEKLVTQVLGIGVGVGVGTWSRGSGELVGREVVERVVRRVVEGEEMREKAKKLAAKARVAVGEGGSSYSDLNALFHDLKARTVARS